MADDTNSCGPGDDVCTIDTKKLIEDRAKEAGKKQDPKNSVLLMVTRGSYGRFDDAYGGILVANAALAKQQSVTILLIGNGIYVAMKDQEPSDIFLPNNLPEISDFLELGGRLVVSQDSIVKRGIKQDELIPGIEMIEDDQIVIEFEKHDVSLTF